MDAQLKTRLAELGLDPQGLDPEKLDTLATLSFDEFNAVKKLHQASQAQPAAWGVFGTLVAF
ncbi:MAG: hypothetical protein GKR89_06740 [Candidatus Latescibacteria bacterium]|nr:hypothetical protein [Candidatus Latescibacterota bacterium]